MKNLCLQQSYPTKTCACNSPTQQKPVLATVLPNNLDTETKTSNCTLKEIYVEIIKMSSPSKNNILKGSMVQTLNKNQKNPTHEKPVPATVLPNKNLCLQQSYPTI